MCMLHSVNNRSVWCQSQVRPRGCCGSDSGTCYQVETSTQGISVLFPSPQIHPPVSCLSPDWGPRRHQGIRNQMYYKIKVLEYLYNQIFNDISDLAIIAQNPSWSDFVLAISVRNWCPAALPSCISCTSEVDTDSSAPSAEPNMGALHKHGNFNDLNLPYIQGIRKIKLFEWHNLPAIIKSN